MGPSSLLFLAHHDVQELTLLVLLAFLTVGFMPIIGWYIVFAY